MSQHDTLKYSLTFLRSDGIHTRCSQHVLPSHWSVKTKGDGHCAMFVENECEETFACRSAKFTGPLVLGKEHAVRLQWTVTTVKTVFCNYYFIILLVVFNTYKVYV